MQKSTFPPPTSPQLSISLFVSIVFRISQNGFKSPCFGDIQMLNICDVDIFDQNLSSADFDIDTQCDIILLLDLHFQFSSRIVNGCNHKCNFSFKSTYMFLFERYYFCKRFLYLYNIMKIETIQLYKSLKWDSRNAQFKFSGGTSIKIHSTIVKEFDKRFFNLKPRNTIR